MNELNHFDSAGSAVMVDVGGKALTERIAIASGKIFVGAEVFTAIKTGTVGKGDVLGVARIAGIMATKKTSDVISLCHSLPISHCHLDFELLPDESAVKAIATVKTTWTIGVEMEALHAVSVALLTVYDMCKAIDKSMSIGEIRLEKKMAAKAANSFH